jgi:hypothetical protein
MRNKRNTVEKLDAQVTKLNTLKKRITNADISGPEAIKFIETIQKDLLFVVERLELERDE